MRALLARDGIGEGEGLGGGVFFVFARLVGDSEVGDGGATRVAGDGELDVGREGGELGAVQLRQRPRNCRFERERERERGGGGERERE